MYMQCEKIKNFARLVLCAATMFVAVPAFAADNSCENEENIVNPALALCSTHVYNVGATENPVDGADREVMKEVIALKTTIMTQQMFKQYEYLESMLKRFKTQLEKAVLTTKLNAAGAASEGSSSSSSDSSSSKSKDKYVVLSSAKNCNDETGNGTLAVYDCLQSNISLVLGAVDDNKTSEAKRQLESDMNITARWGIAKPTACSSLSGATRVRECAYALSRAITSAKEDFELKRTKQQFSIGNN